MSDTKPLLFLVDDDSATLSALDRLFRHDFTIRTFLNPETALKEIVESHPALVLTDSMMPQMNGLEFLRQVRAIQPTALRVLLSGLIASEDLSPAINQGLIHRFFVKPWDNQVLKLQILECLQQHKTLVEKDQLATLALTDPITNLGNHRFFQDQLRVEIERARRHQRIVSLLMMDVDHFKSWNDEYGHPAGDQLLKEVSAHLHQGLRTIDWIARYGGDEFAMILPDTNSKFSFDIAERLRTKFYSLHQGPVAVSLSFGIATFPDHATTAKDLISAADKALYQAKKEGRNQSRIAAPLTS
ncbi:MAG: GGDEF domain-containing response regulator [Pseudobdellovibrionaceae bacterium]